MSGRDLMKDSLTRHRARTKADKRKNYALQQEPKRSGNFLTVILAEAEAELPSLMKL
jgi:hypothetical protein